MPENLLQESKTDSIIVVQSDKTATSQDKNLRKIYNLRNFWGRQICPHRSLESPEF